VKRLKDLEAENALLRRSSDLTLDKMIVAEAAKGLRGQRQQDF
jgi:hypothetical protein